jgi:hypothetical protein
MSDQDASWLPTGFWPPQRVELECGSHLRPVRADDLEIDYPAVMGSRERLWEKYGAAWGWPSATMTLEQDRDDLARHEREIADHESFNYVVLNPDESELLGSIYIDPPDDPESHDALVSWWVVDHRLGSSLEKSSRLRAAMDRHRVAVWELALSPLTAGERDPGRFARA